MRFALTLTMLLLTASFADAGLRGRRGGCSSGSCGASVPIRYPAEQAPAPKKLPAANVAPPTHDPTHEASSGRHGGRRLMGRLHLRRGGC